MQTLKIALTLGTLVLFSACVPDDKDEDEDETDTDTDADTDSDTDSDTDTDTDTDTDADLTYGVLAWRASFEGDGTNLTAGEYGFDVLPYDYYSNIFDLADSPLCAGRTIMEKSATVPAATCPTCEYTYSTVGVAGYTSQGDDCDLIEAMTGSLSDLDVGSEIAFGWSPYYYTSGGDQYPINTAFMYLPEYASYGFFTFSFEYAPYYSVTGSASGSFEIGRVQRDSYTGYPVYTYWY